MLNGCESLKRYVRQVPTIDCTDAQGNNPEKDCEGAVVDSENKLSNSELVDVENRARWLDCIRMHKELNVCLAKHRKDGNIK